MIELEKPPDHQQYASPLRLLVIIAASVFVAEAGVMILLFVLPPLPQVTAAVFDALLLTILIYPVLYRYVMRPMAQHIDERRQAELALRRARDELEVRVEDRTEELTIANAELQEEIEKRQSVEAWLRKSGEELRESQADLKRAQAVAYTGSWRLDLQRNELWWSDETYRMFGIPAGTPLTYETFLAAIHPDDRAYVDQKWAAALHGEPYDIEHRIIAGGVEKWVRERAELEFDQQGGLIGGFGIVHDITERKQAAETMAWLASFPHFNPHPVVEVDLAGHIEYLNPAAQRLLPDLVALGLQHPWLVGLESVGEQLQPDNSPVVTREVTIGAAIYQQTFHLVSNYQRIRIYSLDITERKKMEVALRRAHDELELRVQERTAALAQLSSAVEQTADSVVITDRHGVIEYVNPAFERVTGYARAEAVGSTPRVLKSGEHDDQFYQELWQTILNGEVYFGELINRKKNGELFHEVKTITPIRDEQGAITHFVATGKDITERKRAEQALQQSEMKFRALFETAPVGISVLDQNRQITDVNQALQRIVHATQEGLLEGAFQKRQYIHGDGTPMLPHELASAIAIAENRPVHDVEVGIVTEASDILWVLVSAAPLGLPGAGVVVITQDITERKHAEEQIQLQVAAMEAAANGIVITDLEGRIQWTNPAFSRMSGYAPKEVLGQSTRLFNSGQHDSAYYQQLWATVLAGQVWHGEMINRRKDGSLYFEDQTIAPVRDTQGNVTHFVAIKQDITEHKQAEQAVQWEQAKLKGILSAMQDGVYIVTSDYDIAYINPALEKDFGPVNQRKCYAYLFGRSDVCEWCHNPEVFSGNTIVWERSWPERRKTYELFDTPVRNTDGSLSKLAILHDITTRKRAEEEVERRNRELAALNTVSAAVSRSLELPQVLLTLSHLLSEDLGIPGGAIFLYDEASDLLQFETGWGTPGVLHSAFTSVPADAFHSSRVIRDREPLLTSDVRHAVEFVASKLQVSQPEWQDYLCVPLVAQNRLQGILDLFSRAPAQFTADDVNFFKALGQEVGIAIQNAQLYEAEQRARQTSETLRAASLALTQTLDLDVVVNTLLDYVEQLIPYDTANVMLLETEDRLATRAARDYEQWEDGAQERDRRCDVSAVPIIQHLLSERRSIIIADGLTQPDRAQGLHLFRARSWLGVPLIAGGNVIGLYSLLKLEPGYFTLRHVQLAEALVGQAAVAVQNAWLFDQVRQGRERLQDLSRRLVEVQESERRYVARELHDEAGQALTSLMVGLRLLERDAAQPEALKLGIAELNRLVDSVQENLHRLAVDLRPASLDHLGLVAALRQYVENLGDKHGLVIQFEAVGLGPERLPANIETAIYRIVQEALTNVIRHAHATRVDVLLERRGDRLAAIVEDNGIGFDVAQSQTGRLGLFGIRERAEMLGGTLLIESSERGGTTLVVEVSCDS
jgi:PAS domain S-box-containing protein